MAAAEGSDWVAVAARKKEKPKQPAPLRFNSYHTDGRINSIGGVSPIFVCDLCKVPATSLETLQNHQKGKKHAAAWAALRGGPISSTPPIPPPKPQHRCLICEINCGSDEQLSNHCATPKHAAGVAKKLVTLKCGRQILPQSIANLAWRCFVCDLAVSGPTPLADHLKGAKHRANLQSKNVNRPESVELNTQPGYLQHIDMLASNAHAKPHPLESDEASSSYQQDQEKSPESWDLLEGFKCPLPTWHVNGTGSKQEEPVPYEDAEETSAFELPSEKPPGAESSGEILAAKGLTRPAPLRAHHKKASGSQPEAAATNVGNGSAKPNPDAALEASEQSEISAPSDPNEEFLAELLGELLGPSSKPHPIERPKPVASSPEAPAEAAPNSRETQITSLCSKGDLPADASIAASSTPSVSGNSNDSSEKKKPKSSLLDQLAWCPLAKARMTDPVLASDGHTYERLAIEKWMTTNKVSPMTNKPILGTLMPNLLVRNAIAGLKQT